MATYYPSTPFPVQFINPDTGELLSGGVLRAYLAGTTAPTPMYTNGNGTSAGTSITLNAGGYPTHSNQVIVIWLEVGIDYKFVLEDDEGGGKWSVDNILSITNSFLASNVFGVCKTVADMTSASGPLLTNGQRLNSALIAAAANTGALVRTSMNNTISRLGGADYEIKTLAQHRADIGDGAWTPGGYADHYLLGGTTYVAVMDLSRGIDPAAFNMHPTVADNTAAWQSILSKHPSVVEIRNPGTYTFLSSSNHSSSIKIICAPGVIIDCSDAAFSGGFWTKISGSITQIENLGANAVTGGRSVTFASAPSLGVDDVFIIFNPNASSFSGFRTSYYAGEFCRAISISGNTVNIDGELYDDYASADVEVYKLESKKVFVDGLEIIGDRTGSLFNVEFCRDGTINNLKGRHKNNSIVSLTRCFNVNMDSPSIFNEGDGGSDYGINIINSQLIKINKGEIYSRRHPINIGGDDTVCSVPCRDIVVDGLTLSNDASSTVHCADYHGNAENCRYINCTIYGGAVWRGKNNGYVNCQIGYISYGVCVISAEILGGRHYLINCDLKTIVDPQLVSRAVVDIGGNTTAIGSSTSEDVTFEVKGCSINGQNLSSSTNLFNMENRGTTAKVNYIIDGLHIVVNEFSRVLLTANNSGTAASDFIIVDNVKCSLSGKPLVTHSGSAYLNFPHRLQRQCGSETIDTSTSASFVSGSAVSFKWRYPRAPVVQVSRTGPTYMSNRAGIPLAVGVSGTGLTPRIATDDTTNFSTVEAVTLNWSASIDEI